MYKFPLGEEVHGLSLYTAHILSKMLKMDVNGRLKVIILHEFLKDCNL